MPEHRREESRTEQPAHQERPEQVNEATETSSGAPETEAQDVVRRSAEAAVEGARAAGATGATMVPRAAVQASPADITDEIDKGGPAFGAFVKAVGLGVAEAQAKLDATLVDTAKALSETQIDVIAVFEQQIDDNGQMTTGKIHKEKLPLVNYIMPTAYQWSRVYLSADMNMSEINATNGFNIQGSSSSFTAGVSGGYGLMQGGWNVKGDTRFTTGGYQQGGENSTAQDKAQGQLHMEATLESRDDIQLPRPFVLQKGPRLKITAGARQDIPGTGAPVPPATTVDPIGRTVTLTLELKGQTNNALANKQLEYRINQPLLNYTTTPANGMTDANGQLKIELRREGAAFDKTKPPEPVTVTAWLGLVNEQVVVNI
jgi:hypothetical protein